jgi:hypothetical protein
VKAFVSSTVSDLAAYRATVNDTLERLGIEYVTLESLIASSVPADSVLEALSSADIFILLLGYRYGSIAPKGGISWVEVEFRAAQQMSKPILVFMARPDTQWPVNAIDLDRSRVEGFREEVASSYLVSYFTSPEDLASKLATSLLHVLIRVIEGPKLAKRSAAPVKTVRIIRLLLSSPGDVVEERRACARAVFRFNQQEVEQSGLFIKLIRWEEMAPQIGSGPQQVINDQIGEYDIFCGIMWNRFGTPTDVASSGTEEEFRGALAEWRRIRRPWVAFYFCDRPATFTTQEQLEQKGKVIGFKSELSGLGIVRTYTTIDDFENLVFQDLLRITATTKFKDSLKGE